MTVVDDTSSIADVPPLWRILEAIGEGEFHPRYQPIVSLETGQVVAVEALARWSQPETGVLPATSFVPVLERHRRVTDLTAFMLDRACADLAAWQRSLALDGEFRVAINVSATELSDRRLAALVRESLAEHGVSASGLCLELTETARIDDMRVARNVLAELATDIGVRLAVDDYGTGFSDGSYLTAFPVDTVKIDHTFVNGMTHRADHAAFVRATVGYAEHRSMAVVAEGVETQGQADALLSVGCRLAQGWGIGMPCPAEQIFETHFGTSLASAVAH